MANRVFEELLRGKAAHADPIACIEDVSAELAGKRIDGFPHSIWQLVNHMNYWMDYEIKRVAGHAPPYPQHAAQSWLEEAVPSTESHWSDSKVEFDALLRKTESPGAGSPVPDDVQGRDGTRCWHCRWPSDHRSQHRSRGACARRTSTSFSCTTYPPAPSTTRCSTSSTRSFGAATHAPRVSPRLGPRPRRSLRPPARFRPSCRRRPTRSRRRFPDGR